MKKQLRKSEIKDLSEEIRSCFGIDPKISAKDRVEVNDDIIMINGEPAFFYHEGRIVPHLKRLIASQFLKPVTVDMGAVRFMVKGADLMRPGITKVGPGISKDDIIAIIDESHSKPIAVGISLFSSQEIESMDSGKVIRTIHYVGDRIWNISA